MPRRDFFSPAQLLELVAIPEDEGELIRLYSLLPQDLAIIRQRRGDANRLGFAAQLCSIRFPGLVIGQNDSPDQRMLGMISRQLMIDPGLWTNYAGRDQTRREHLQAIIGIYGYRQFNVADYRSLSIWLLPFALQSDQSMVLGRAVLNEVRARRIIVPPLPVIERLCAETATRALRHIYAALTSPLTMGQRKQLEALFLPYENRQISVLAWLRLPVSKTGPRHMNTLLARLHRVRSLDLAPGLEHAVHRNRLLKLARMAERTTLQHMRRFDEAQRYALLVALLLETRATLTDEILTMHDRIMGKLFARAKRKHEEAFLESAQTINEKIRIFAKVGQALLDARRTGEDPFTAIEAILPWETFEASVTEADGIVKPTMDDSLSLIGTSYSQIRRYAPLFLETFEFRSAPGAEGLLQAIHLLRQLNASDVREVPADAPRNFIRKRWKPLLFSGTVIDRRFYELCVLAELKNALRSGDLWVSGSRQFNDFKEYILSPEAFEQLKHDGFSLPVEPDREKYLSGRMEQLRSQLVAVDKLAALGQLPDVTFTKGVLKITPLDKLVPDEAEAAMRKVYALMPHVRITELLLEVDRWTGFTRHFTNLKTGESPSDPAILLTAVLADGINLGLAKMAEVCPMMTYTKLAWLTAWHIRDATYSKALAELVNAQHQQSLAIVWGAGNTSSSDGQRYRAGGRGEPAGQMNLKYGTDPSVMLYTHISDRYAPFHSRVINANIREATFVLDGLLYHESDLRIEEHYTDTAGFTDHVFGLCHLLGYRFAPRIRDLADKKLFLPDREGEYPALEGMVGGAIQKGHILSHWEEVTRLAASIVHGTATASLLLRKLGSYPRQNGLAVALREVGRIERTLFILQWLQDSGLRRRVQVGLNKGEARNALARAVFLNRLGEMRDRGFEHQNHRACALNLIVAAITLWNTIYLERALEALRERGEPIPSELVRHLSPLGWEHINLTGNYVWSLNKLVAQGRFRPLRNP
ncbi:MAG: Tn3 family transposase [Desulfovibrio sp.]|nr:Tn3 family transposase [Desulfovibrio sp.]